MKAKKVIIIAAVTASVLVAGTASAQSFDIGKIIDTQLSRLVPDNLRQLYTQIKSGGAIGIDTIGSVFKAGDDNGNINEEAWKELGSATLDISNNPLLKNAGVDAGYVGGQLAQTGLKNLNNLNIRKSRESENAFNANLPNVRQALITNSQEAESTLQANNQSNQIAAAAAGIEVEKVNVQRQATSAQQIANTNALKKRQEELAKERANQIGLKATNDQERSLIGTITRPDRGGQ